MYIPRFMDRLLVKAVKTHNAIKSRYFPVNLFP